MVKNFFLQDNEKVRRVDLEKGQHAVAYDFLTVSSPAMDERRTTIIVPTQAQLVLLCQQERRLESFGNNKYRIEAGQDATVDVFIFLEGSSQGKFSYDLVLKGERAQINVYGVYLITDKHRVDIHLEQQHDAPNTSSKVLIKGALFDKAQTDFYGKITIASTADFSHAELYNKNVLFSEQVRAKSKPELEVLANEVQCKHGSALGNIDEEHLFYMQSRGFSAAHAQQFLLFAFLGEIFSLVPETKVQKSWQQRASILKFV